MTERRLDTGANDASTERDLVRDYLDEAGKTPLLDAEQEVALAIRIEAGQYAARLLEKMPDEIDASLREELEWIAADGAEAKEHFIKANLRLVISIAKKKAGNGLSLLDLIQVGNEGLIRGVQKFDYTKGYKFSTYGTWWIRQSITRGIADTGRTIRIPVHMNERISAMYLLEKQLGREGLAPTPEMLAEKMETTVEDIMDMKDISRHSVSLNLPVGDGDGAELQDLLVDNIPPVDVVARTEMTTYTQKLLDSLPDEEALVLRMRYGFYGRVYTLDEVGKVIRGVSKERIRQIEVRAKMRIRSMTSYDDLSDILDA